MNSQLMNLKIQVLLDEHEAIEEEAERLIRERADNCHHDPRRVWHYDEWFTVCVKCGASQDMNCLGAPKDMSRQELLDIRRKLTGPVNIHDDYEL